MSLLFILLLMLIECSLSEQKHSFASDVFEPKEFGVVSISNSTARIYFSGTTENGKSKYYVFLEIRDSNGINVDYSLSEIRLITDNGKEIEYTHQRSSVGKYYLIPSNTSTVHSKGLKVTIGSNVLINLKLNHSWKQLKSEIQLIKKSAHRATFHFRLLNEFKAQVEISDAPDIIINSEQGFIEEVAPVDKNIWKFDIVYPEGQFINISVRSHGILFSNIFRIDR